MAPPGAIALLVIGAALHGWSMLARRQGERARGTVLPAWSAARFWLCWGALIALAAVLLLRR